ncbi:MAG: YdeI/OmpD-associated family protein [Dehalococcoidia bacterium]
MEFTATLVARPGGGAYVELPFDPTQSWSAKDRHHVTGTIDGRKFRGAVIQQGDRFALPLGPAWVRGCAAPVGDDVAVVLTPEGPQLESLAPDLAAALAAEPQALAFFNSLATFYRTAYLKWVDATTRRPELRAERIEELVGLLKVGKKER